MLQAEVTASAKALRKYEWVCLKNRKVTSMPCGREVDGATELDPVGLVGCNKGEQGKYGQVLSRENR